MPRNRAIALVIVGIVLVVGVMVLVAFLVGDETDLERNQDVDSAPAATDTASEAEADPGATEAPDPALEPFYSQQVEWEECPTGAGLECATMTVPLDYAEPEGETLDLALLRNPADEGADRVGSLVVNPGGPGAPGTQYAAVSDFVFRAPILEAFDIVGFDPRGTGSSSPVDCLDDERLDALYAADPAPDTGAERQELTGLYDDLAAGCAADGPLAEHVSTREAAQDVDVLRAVLGESSLTYFGASYGTKLGATYADEFPDRVGRLVLDGGIDVSLSSREVTLGQAGGFETALTAYVTDCVDGGDCYLGDDVDAGLDTVADFLADVDDEPLAVGDRELTAGTAFYGLATPLYSEQSWPQLDEALGAALDGDGAGMLAFADAYSSRQPDGSYADNSSEAIYAVNCLDDPYALPVSDVPGEVGDFERVSPTFGEVFAYSLSSCQGFPGAGPDATGSGPEPGETIAQGAEPIVVVGTTRDPATPYEWSQALADQLESGVLVSRDGDGHTGYNQGNACVDDAVESYLVEGTVPDDGLEC
ncbi:alpha/beta hydrolase [uncultured Nocardioides sp.]|uniref:alpha/beta hydrolase n=1 Tax=uncultured Nocardioides sp. TaxID=198441 RepID=UPI002623689D|nr:alpha/beta hydrolase [uncultured Nocardioides sp.]